MDEHPLVLSCTAAVLAGVLIGIGFRGVLIGAIGLLLFIFYLFGAVVNMNNCARDGRQSLHSLLTLIVLTGICVVFGYVIIRYFITSNIIEMFQP
jgi:ABC-type transport system involved in cytochrome c biogenesis permease component